MSHISLGDRLEFLFPVFLEKSRPRHGHALLEDIDRTLSNKQAFCTKTPKRERVSESKKLNISQYLQISL